MSFVATGSGSLIVQSLTGIGDNCADPVATTTGECSTKVFVQGIGVVREGDKVFPHPKLGCDVDESVLTTFSAKVKIEGRGLGRLGDYYTGDNQIVEGNVKVNSA